MSWTDKRISLPAFLHGNSDGSPSDSRSNNNTGDSARDIAKSLVLSAYLRKFKTNKLKWFVLYGDVPGEPSNPAHLEYHDDERKWRAGFPPKRSIALGQCLNICRKRDTRVSKNKRVLALYTLDDCVGILYETEDELKIWLDLLLSHQQGRNTTGKIPKPNYEHMWQVKVRNFQPESKSSQFYMSGSHRLCVTSDEVKFFPVGSGEPIVFPVDCIRNCGTINRIFRLETGRSSVSGPGLVIIECEDREIANNINVRVLESMRDSESEDSSNNRRPRSESWGNMDRPILPSSAPSTSKILNVSSSNKSSLSTIPGSRHRTSSEGAHSFDPSKRKYHHHHAMSSGPNSPGPFLHSSESAGSINSIEDSNDYCSSMTPDNDIAVTTIYEESSGETISEKLIKAEEHLHDQPEDSYVDMTEGGLLNLMTLGHSLDLTSPTSSSVASLGLNDCEYQVMSPELIPLKPSLQQESSYVTMSPIDPEKHKSQPDDNPGLDFSLDPESNYVPFNFDSRAGPMGPIQGFRRLSPASSSSQMSAGTPLLLDFSMLDKSVSHILKDPPPITGFPLGHPPRAYSVGSKNTLPRNPKNGSKCIDIPSGKSSGGHWLKQSPSTTGSSGRSPSTSSLVSRLDSWVRNRAGSVPSRPPFFERKRHRTQSEGEKEEAKLQR